MHNASIENNFYFPNIILPINRINEIKSRESKTIIKLQQSSTNSKSTKSTKSIYNSSNNLIPQIKLIKSKFENKEINTKNKNILSRSLININEYNKKKEKNKKKIKSLKEIFSNEFVMKNKLSTIKEYNEKKNPFELKIKIKNERKSMVINRKTVKLNNINSRNKSVILKNVLLNFNIDKFTNKIREKEELELKLEQKDKYNDLSINDLKVLSKTKKYFLKLNFYFKILSNDTKNFFKIKENKINFIEDCNIIPFLQNKFVKLKATNFYYYKVPNNIIKPNILRYLNQLRFQIDKDNQLSKLNKENVRSFESQLEEIIFKNKDLISYTEEYKIYYRDIIKLENKVDNYLNIKYSKYQKVKITNEKNRKAIFSIFEKNKY